MRTFGIILVVLGVVACLLAIVDANGNPAAVGAVAMAIAAVGIVGAGAVILRNSRSN